ncbi:MAG: response regulator, partial [Bacteroidetes bacterium]|nr:response regulator [Bacteroidota bacterium]
DDNANVRAFLREQLARDVADIVECTSGEDALAAYAAVAPDIVLMDIVMPGMDGLEATERIHELDRNARIFIVTDYGDEEFRRAAFARGARGFYLKEQVMILLSELLGEQGARTNSLRTIP